MKKGDKCTFICKDIIEATPDFILYGVKEDNKEYRKYVEKYNKDHLIKGHTYEATMTGVSLFEDTDPPSLASNMTVNSLGEDDIKDRVIYRIEIPGSIKRRKLTERITVQIIEYLENYPNVCTSNVEVPKDWYDNIMEELNEIIETRIKDHKQKGEEIKFRDNIYFIYDKTDSRMNDFLKMYKYYDIISEDDKEDIFPLTLKVGSLIELPDYLKTTLNNLRPW